MSEQTPVATVPTEVPTAAPEEKTNIILPAIFFPLAMVYHELLLQSFHGDGIFSLNLLPIVCFAVAAGLWVMLLVDLLPPKVSRVVAILLTALWTVYIGVSYCCKSYFKIYFSLSYMFTMADSVTANFASEIGLIIREALPFIALDLLPLLLLVLFLKKIVPDVPLALPKRIIALTLAALCLTGGIIMGLCGEYRAQFTYDYNANDTTPLFGLTASTGLELVYSVVGAPDAPAAVFPDDPSIAEPPQPVLYEANAMDIPFTDMIAASPDAQRSTHTYFSTRTATMKNEYTGFFEGKNLILITAEAFSPHVISPELTPTLYKLSTNGFVFENYYQPLWGQSTTGGEFAVITGLIPTWVNNQVSFYASHDNYMPFALGNQFRKLGYTTLAYHNNTYNYYSRDLTHPNLGYDYYGLGNGLTGIDTNMSGPFSDLDLMTATVDAYLSDYVENGTPFHAYYMTFSGHANWGWGHSMARKNRDVVEAAYPEASTMVKAYIAANLELEYALQYLVERLEDAGALEDTVICLSSDHYPYAMKGEDYNYYPELSGSDVTDRDSECYRSTLIMYCASMSSPVNVSEPCTAIDIVPTLSNLFGLEYDSRLLSGRDVLAPYTASAVSSIPIAIIPVEGGKCWRTPLGVYESSTRTFTANPGVSVPEDYARRINEMVEQKYTYAKELIATDYYRILFPEDVSAS